PTRLPLGIVHCAGFRHPATPSEPGRDRHFATCWRASPADSRSLASALALLARVGSLQGVDLVLELLDPRRVERLRLLNLGALLSVEHADLALLELCALRQIGPERVVVLPDLRLLGRTAGQRQGDILLLLDLGPLELQLLFGQAVATLDRLVARLDRLD